MARSRRPSQARTPNPMIPKTTPNPNNSTRIGKLRPVPPPKVNDHGPIPKAESSPNPEPDDPEARTRTILLMQLSKTPIKNRLTPSRGVFMEFYGLSAILCYILWVMIYYTHIWCYVLHARLR